MLTEGIEWEFSSRCRVIFSERVMLARIVLGLHSSVVSCTVVVIIYKRRISVMQRLMGAKTCSACLSALVNVIEEIENRAVHECRLWESPEMRVIDERHGTDNRGGVG